MKTLETLMRIAPPKLHAERSADKGIETERPLQLMQQVKQAMSKFLHSKIYAYAMSWSMGCAASFASASCSPSWVAAGLPSCCCCSSPAAGAPAGSAPSAAAWGAPCLASALSLLSFAPWSLSVAADFRFLAEAASAFFFAAASLAAAQAIVL
jgi:hypothetical protein